MFAPGFAAQISSIYAQVGRTLGAPSCPLLAQSGHPNSVKQCPLLGVKRTSAYLLADIYAGPTSPTYTSGFALSPIAPLSWAAVVGCRTGANRLGPPPSCGDAQSDAKSLSSCPRTRVSQIVTVFSDL